MVDITIIIINPHTHCQLIPSGIIMMLTIIAIITKLDIISETFMY